VLGLIEELSSISDYSGGGYISSRSVSTFGLLGELISLIDKKKKKIKPFEQREDVLSEEGLDSRTFDKDVEGKIYVCGVYGGRGRISGAEGVSYSDSNTSLGVGNVQGAIDVFYNEFKSHNHDDLYYRKTEVDNRFVHLEEDEVIDGIKTFLLSPVVPSPMSGNNAVNKEYVDNSLSDLDGQVVHLEGDENINGVKTFVLSPVIPDPVNNNEAASKGYVDNAASNLDASMVHISGEEEIEGKKTMVGGCEIVGEDLTPTKPKGFTMVVDEGNNQLVFRVLYSDGSTLKIGSVSLS